LDAISALSSFLVHIERQTEADSERQTDRQTDRQTERDERDRETAIER